MKRTGVVYQRNKRKPLTKALGIACLGLALASGLIFLSPLLAPQVVEVTQPKDSQFGKIIAQELDYSQELKPNTPEAVDSFYLTIDKIGLLRARVIPQVDADSKAAYETALKQGLVHSRDTYLPGQTGLVYIFGHSTNYPWLINDLNALFFKAKDLEPGDRIKLEFNGRHYVYYVSHKQVVEADQVGLIKDKINQDLLVLQTCWPPGTTWKRLLIFARPSKFGGFL